MSLTRRGASLVELLVALGLSAIVLTAAHRAVRYEGRDAAAFRAMRHQEGAGEEVVSVLLALGRHLRHLAPRGDTALAAEYRVLVGVACRVGDGFVVLAPGSVGSREALTFLNEAPQPGDLLERYVPGTDTLPDAGWVVGRITAVTMLPAVEGCGMERRFLPTEVTDATVLRLDHDSVAMPGRPGIPIEVYRTGRLVSYESGTAGWVVGWRTCPSGRCDPVQPIVGPVRSVREEGLRFLVDATAVRVRVRIPGQTRVFEGTLRATDAVR